MNRLGPIYLTVFVDVLALTLVLPLLPYYAESLGASPLVVGLLLASFSLCQFVSGPLLGRLSDRIGRKPVLLGSQFGTAIGLVILGLSGRIEWLFVGRIIDGLTAGNLSIAQAIVADQSTPETRTRSFAFFGIAFGVGFLIGPAASGLMAHRWSYSVPPLVAAGLSLLSMVLTATFVKESKRSGPPRLGLTESLRSVLSRPAARRHLFTLIFYVFSFSTLTGGLGLFLARRMSFGVDETGYAFAFSGLVGALMQGGIGRLAKRIGDQRLVRIGLVVMTFGYGVLAFVSSVPHLAIALALGGIGAAVVRPAATSLLTSSVAEDERGLALGVSQSGTSLAQAAGPALAGLVINAGALGAWAALAAVGAILSLVVSYGARGEVSSAASGALDRGA